MIVINKCAQICMLALVLILFPSFYFYSCVTTKSKGTFSDLQQEITTENLELISLEDMQPNAPEFVYPVTDKNSKTLASISTDYLAKLSPVTFSEIWGYLSSGDETSYNSIYPITDIGYFNAGLNTFGELTGVPDRKKLPQSAARVHLVIADNSRALTHFCLDPQYSVRTKLITSIIAAAKPFDGLQIDFELVSAVDKEYYLTFLTELKSRIGKYKILSVAVPARVQTSKEDVYDYEQISKIADKIIVMAYDEHWSGSKPGAIASFDWCKKVAGYASTMIPRQKLVMGVPFYGRAWSDGDLSGAYRFSSIDRLFRGETANEMLPPDTSLTPVTLVHNVPSFTITKNVTYTFYFDNALSLFRRLSLYHDCNITAAAFWRLGQEDKDIWPLLHISN